MSKRLSHGREGLRLSIAFFRTRIDSLNRLEFRLGGLAYTVMPAGVRPLPQKASVG